MTKGKVLNPCPGSDGAISVSLCILVRYYPRTETRLFLLKHCRGKLRTIDGSEENSA